MSGVVVAGHVRVPAEHRDQAIRGYRALTEAARRAPGCRDLSIAADPIDPDRVVICEIWETEEELAAWRRVAPPPEIPEGFEVYDVQMWEYVVATRREPFSGPFDRDS